jgi:hypothetical protein
VNANNVSIQAAGDDEDSLLGFDLRSDGSGHKWVPFPFKCHVIVITYSLRVFPVHFLGSCIHILLSLLVGVVNLRT